MKEISLHITDIVQNSIVAGATLVKISINEDIPRNLLEISIEDNGKGMNKELLESVVDPFTTSRTTRKVGLGIPLFKQATNLSGGDLTIESNVGVGTTVTATFIHDHIDRQPLGDMVSTILATVVSHSDIDFVYTHSYCGNSFTFDTRDVKKVLGGVSFSEPDVYMWIKSYLEEGESDILK